MYSRKIILMILVVIVALFCSSSSNALETNGKIYDTDVEYSDLVISKEGVSLKLTNTFSTPVKLSFSINFYDKNGNKIGHSIFGLRELAAESSSEYRGNYITGSWKACRDSFRAVFEKMTYEPIYR